MSGSSHRYVTATDVGYRYETFVYHADLTIGHNVNEICLNNSMPEPRAGESVSRETELRRSCIESTIS